MVRYTFVVAKQTTEETDKKTVYKIDLKHDDGHKLTLKSNSASIFAGFPVDEPIEVSVKPMNTLDEFEDTPELTSEEE